MSVKQKIYVVKIYYNIINFVDGLQRAKCNATPFCFSDFF